MLVKIFLEKKIFHYHYIISLSVTIVIFLLLVLGINEGTKLTYLLNTARLPRAYKLHGQLGKATDTYFWNGKTVERSMHKHVSREKIDRVVAHMQAAHQKAMYE